MLHVSLEPAFYPVTEFSAEAACIRILIAVDGSGSYFNSDSAGFERHDVHQRFVAEVTEWTLALPTGALRAAIERRGAGQS